MLEERLNLHHGLEDPNLSAHDGLAQARRPIVVGRPNYCRPCV